MQQIRPVSDLRNKITEITHEVVEEQNPVILTKNGYGHMVIMSYSEYEHLTNLKELYMAVDEGIEDIKTGRTVDSKSFMTKLHEDINNGHL